ncbi:hypothetical protein HF521_019892 [Silurus meridionalis]|uniref:Ig-like domain-containing protein n=1 Tax=Silurus meridionalis TaxID=175797 RepID=A0A8T0BHT6_SILME|nr:hypothetical protein HF521_019892 [Silurus meridionalis]
MELRLMILLISLIRVGQAQVKPVLSVQPNSSQIFRGEEVTLTCTILGRSIMYYWLRDDVYTHSSNENVYTIKIHQRHRYTCLGSIVAWSVTPLSNEVTLSVIERPKAVVTLQPDGQIFNGEKVMFVCEIQEHSDSEWTYNWYKDDVQIFPYNESRNYSFTALESVSGKYTCRGQRKSDSQSSETSNAVTLTVSEKPKPELTSDLKGAALTGNSVTLYCTLKLQSAGWKFYWSKDTQRRDTETETHSYTIRSVRVSDGGQYRCRAGRGNPVYYTHYSDALWVNVTGESPPVSLIINPSRTQHFTADSISLSCENHRDFTGWTVRGYTCNETWFDCLSVSGSTCNISSLSPSHTGVYWCQSESGECSNPVNITVHNGDVILDSPVHPLTEGRPLTLHCLYRNTKISDSGVDFYKDDLIVQNQTTGEMIFSSVSKSDEGFYHCKHPERGESPKSWISVRDSEAPVSVFRLMSSLMTVSVYLLLTIVVAVKCYRAREKPKPELTSDLKEAALTGNSVTLYCTLKLQSAGWKFYWSKDTQSRETETETHSYTIRSVSVSDGGQYWCRAGRGNPVYYTHYSDALWVKVTEKPKPELTSDLKEAALTGNSVTLYCTLKLQSAGWKFYWSKDTQSRETETETHSYTIRSVNVSDGGQYWCRAGRGNPVYYTHYSDALWVNVTDAAEAVVSVSPQSWLTEGDSVTLNCEIKSSSTDWTFSCIYQRFCTEKCNREALGFQDQPLPFHSMNQPPAFSSHVIP